jgi:hypothetical protein
MVENDIFSMSDVRHLSGARRATLAMSVDRGKADLAVGA